MYRGIIIEESLKDQSLLNTVRIIGTEIESVTAGHRTPWLKEWTLDEVEIDDEAIKSFVRKVQNSIETEHKSWFADFKGDQDHYVVFPDKIFFIDHRRNDSYDKAISYGVALGIPRNQIEAIRSSKH